MLATSIGAFLLAPFMMFPSFGNTSDHSLSLETPRAFAQVNAETSVRGGWWEERKNNRPTVKEIAPGQGAIGTEVTLSGDNFSEESEVLFGKHKIDGVTFDDTNDMLTFTVPETIERDCVWWQRSCEDKDVEAGTYTVRVEENNRLSNTVRFEVTESDPDPDAPLSISEISGPTSLATHSEGTWTVKVGSDSDAELMYSVKWGDEKAGLFGLFRSEEDQYQSSATFTHTYRDEGTYTPEFTVKDAEGNTVTKTSASVMVSDDTEQVPAVDTIEPKSVEVGGSVTVTGSGFDTDSRVRIGGMWATDVKVESDTKISFTVPALTLGAHQLFVRDSDGRSNAVSLTVVEKETKGYVSVSSITAPTELEVGEEGTWTIHADSSLEGNLRYSVVWGDENMMTSRVSADGAVQSSAIFTHTYQSEGSYTPKFIVTDEEGSSASASASVRVVSTE